MKTIRSGSFLLSILTVIALTMFMSTSAQAAIIKKTVVGTEVSEGPALSAGNASSYLAHPDQSKCVGRGSAVVVKKGDLIYVGDSCADGYSMIAQLSYDYQGDTYIRVCKVPGGAGTIGRCNFNWEEAPLKTIHVAAVKSGSKTIWGTPSHFLE